MTLDLGYGTTMMYLGGPVMERTPVWSKVDEASDSPDGTVITASAG